MCLFLNSRFTISFSNEKTPINTVLLGGMHSLHYLNGKLVTDNYWYEPNYKRVRPKVIPSSNIKKFTSDYKWFINNLNKSFYANKLTDSLLRYVRAFDESDKNTVLLKCWGAIESLVASDHNNCDMVSKRVSFLFADREYHKQVIEHLREYRNSSVHSGEVLQDTAVHCYQVQHYFLHLILFYVRNAEVFCDFNEANSFLDLPSDLNMLGRRKELIDKAISFVNPVEN